MLVVARGASDTTDFYRLMTLARPGGNCFSSGYSARSNRLSPAVILPAHSHLFVEPLDPLCSCYGTRYMNVFYLCTSTYLVLGEALTETFTSFTSPHHTQQPTSRPVTAYLMALDIALSIFSLLSGAPARCPTLWSCSFLAIYQSLALGYAQIQGSSPQIKSVALTYIQATVLGSS